MAVSLAAVAGVTNVHVNASSGSFTSFSPVAGKAYLIGVSASTDGSGSPAATITGVAWATGGTITKAGGFAASSFGVEVSFWYCKASQQGSGAITVTGNAAVPWLLAWIKEVTGADPTTPTGTPVTSSATTNQLALTPTSTGGLIVLEGHDQSEGPAPTANGVSVIADSMTDNGELRYGLFGSANTVATVSQTLGITNTLTQNTQIAMELLPAPAGGLPAQPIVAPSAAVIRAATW